MATAFQSESHPDDCAVFTGSLGNVKYRYFSRGANCATNADSEAIQDDLHHRFQQLDADSIPDSQCIKYDEGGAWDGCCMAMLAQSILRSTADHNFMAGLKQTPILSCKEDGFDTVERISTY